MGWRWWSGVECWEGGMFEDLIDFLFERLSVGVGVGVDEPCD